MDTLHGSLEIFKLEPICRLISATELTGVLRIEARPMVGRVFFVDGAVSYATTREQDGSVTDLFRIGGRADRPERERRGRKTAAKWPQPLLELVQQQIVEVFVRLIRQEKGQFWFVEGVKTRAYGSEAEQHFELAELLEQAKERREEWRAIEAYVPDSTTRFQLRPELDDQFEVTLDARSWEFLASVGDGSSVQEIAERLQMFEFPAAKKVADFVRRGLLVPDDTPPSFVEELEHVDHEHEDEAAEADVRTVVLSVEPAEELVDEAVSEEPPAPQAASDGGP